MGKVNINIFHKGEERANQISVKHEFRVNTETKISEDREKNWMKARWICQRKLMVPFLVI